MACWKCQVSNVQKSYYTRNGVGGFKYQYKFQRIIWRKQTFNGYLYPFLTLLIKHFHSGPRRLSPQSTQVLWWQFWVHSHLWWLWHRGKKFESWCLHHWWWTESSFSFWYQIKTQWSNRDCRCIWSIPLDKTFGWVKYFLYGNVLPFSCTNRLKA